MIGLCWLYSWHSPIKLSITGKNNMVLLSIDNLSKAFGGVMAINRVSFTLDDGEYVAECDSYGDIFITKSPYFTTCRYCSPCAPGAGYLMNYDPDGIRAYCFGPDWFDNNVAPYKVYSVATGEKP